MKTTLTTEQHDKLQKLGIDANDLTSLIDCIPPFERGKLTIMRKNDEWLVASLYSESISHSEVNAVWKIKFSTKELIDAVYKFIVWSIESKGSGFYY